MQRILEKVKLLRNRSSTRANYYSLWKLFNKFIIQLDTIPDTWEERVYLYLAHLVHTGKKSTTVRSYLSGIKAILWDDKYELQENAMELKATTRACRLINDKIHPRRPIKLDLLEIILFEIDRMFASQPYLRKMYQVLFATAYYRLFRIGEIAMSNHAMQARDVNIGTNKDKILIYLYSSKTHGPESKPQKIKIAASHSPSQLIQTKRNQEFRHFCPFKLLLDYMLVRGDYLHEEEPFFVLQGHIPLNHDLIRLTLAKAITKAGLDVKFYSFQALRSGRATDLFNWGVPVELIKMIGRWKSNAVYKYFKF